MDISYCFTLIFACIQIIGAVQSGEQNIPNQILQDNTMKESYPNTVDKFSKKQLEEFSSADVYKMTSFGRAGAVRNNTVAKAKELQELKPIFSSIFEDSDDDSEEESDDDNQTTLAKEECKTETNVAERLKKDELREGNSDGSMHASDSKKNSSFPETSSNVKFVKITPHIGSSISQIGGRGITRKKIKPLHSTAITNDHGKGEESLVDVICDDVEDDLASARRRNQSNLRKKKRKISFN